ncbi:unnamed protein product [Trichogramma brassicae]|uniref:Reverse transcriptase domain-containing protein n=1 Tax=Trichogramma brassicae TaxID=86971 RepID=A0A6H5II77_9HYME|nr:unnamed protein product [Trichogramma brassicae]
MIDSNQMRKVDIPPKDYGSHYFLPHHAVVKESSTTTRVRTVFNASARNAAGQSLNEHHMTWLNLLPQLVLVLAHWHCYPIAFVADVSKMYLQVRLHSEDWKLQSILWRLHIDARKRHTGLRVVHRKLRLDQHTTAQRQRPKSRDAPIPAVTYTPTPKAELAQRRRDKAAKARALLRPPDAIEDIFASGQPVSDAEYNAWKANLLSRGRPWAYRNGPTAKEDIRNRRGASG